ncbi:MAG: GntR family transcriptional regulator [Acidobacteriota bacterium]
MDRLRSAIVTGHYDAGSRLAEKELTDRLQVSRTPVREALRRLESEGLVVGYPHRGYFVRDPSFEEAKQAYETRRVVESACAELAAARATEVDLAAMRQALKRASKALEAGDRSRLLLCNKEIHHLVARAADNVFLEKQWLAMWAFAELLRGSEWVKTDRPETGHAEHVALVQAIADRDSDRARQLSEQHVTLAWANIAERFEDDSD